jgi:putative FmdB family regulatory protein
MPAYDFRCTSCSHTFEITRPLGSSEAPDCPACGEPTKRVFTPVGVHFKGSGFYSTDHKAKNPAAKPPEAKPAEAPACSKSDSPGCAGCPAAGGE